MNPLLIIVAVVGLVLGLAGGTAVRVMTAPKPVAVAADSTHAAHGDSTAHGAHGDSTAHVAHADSAGHGAPHDSTGHGGADAAPADPHAVNAHAASAPGPVVTTVKPAHAIPASLDPEERAKAFKQVGSILLAMKPVETGKILAYMNDEHVEGILRQMGPRQAATMLSQLPPERAAGLSRRLLSPERSAR